MLSDLSGIPRALAIVMSEKSEDTYCAGWMRDLEFELWKALRNADGRHAGYSLSPNEITTFRILSELCGGWIVYDEVTEETFVPLSEWEKRFAEFEAGPRGSASMPLTP